MDRNLVFDIGFHKGEDSRYYLYRGYNVVAVDASLHLVKEGSELFAQEIKEKRLTLINAVVADEERDEVLFYISNNSEWSSTNKYIAGRNGMLAQELRLSAIGLNHLIKDYGVPYYCKIDIEGNDILALKSLEKVEELPLYISVETECLGHNVKDGDVSIYDTLIQLHRLGYSRFKLVDQSTFSVLGNSPFYSNKELGFDYHLADKLYAKRILHTTDSYSTFSEFFANGSGPFGEDLLGEWFNFESAKCIITRHVQDQRSLGYAKWSFWCDWHATY